MSRSRISDRSRALAACVALHVALAATVASGDDQPQWGQRYSRNMVSSETGLPSDFDLEGSESLKWSVPLGNQTYSTPVIASGRVLIGLKMLEGEWPPLPRDQNTTNPSMQTHKRDAGVVYLPPLSSVRVLTIWAVAAHPLSRLPNADPTTAPAFRLGTHQTRRRAKSRIQA